MAVTIKDVAKAAGVSITTVSMVLSSTDYSISEKTKRKVLEAVKKLNYVPNEFAKSLVQKKSNLIALFIPDLTNPFYPEIGKSVSIVAEQRRYNVILVNSNNNKYAENDSLRILENGVIDGALVISRDVASYPSRGAGSLAIHVVYVDDIAYEVNSDSFLVTGDNERGGYLAAEYLISQGHKKLACIDGPEDSANSARRINGFLKACEEHDLYIHSDRIVCGNYSYQGGYEAAQKLLPCDITGIFCCNDISAYGAIKRLKEENLRVPEDISVIGYDDLPMNKYLEPALTTINQYPYKIGERATHLLLNLIEGKKVEDSKVLINPKLIIRSSVAPVSTDQRSKKANKIFK